MREPATIRQVHFLLDDELRERSASATTSWLGQVSLKRTTLSCLTGRRARNAGGLPTCRALPPRKSAPQSVSWGGVASLGRQDESLLVPAPQSQRSGFCAGRCGPEQNLPRIRPCTPG